MCVFNIVKMSFALLLTAGQNGGKLHALTFMNLTKEGIPSSVFEQIFINSFYVETLVSIRIPQINVEKVISLDSSNEYTYSENFMEDISVPTNVSQL